MRAFILLVLIVSNTWAGDRLNTAALRQSTVVSRDAEGLVHRMDARGREIVYENAVLVKLVPGALPENVFKSYGATRHEQIAPHLYRIPFSEGTDALTVAEALEQDKRVQFAHPDFHSPKRLR